LCIRTCKLFIFRKSGKSSAPVSIDRARKIVSRMSESSKMTLLKPIKDGLITPNGVIKLSNGISLEPVAIRVKDLLKIAITDSEVGVHPTSGIVEEINPSLYHRDIPPRLLNAYMKHIDNDRSYASIDNSSVTQSWKSFAKSKSTSRLHDLVPLPALAAQSSDKARHYKAHLNKPYFKKLQSSNIFQHLFSLSNKKILAISALILFILIIVSIAILLPTFFNAS
jgi:hypothetical protein